MKGKGMPVTGRRRMLTATLMNTWNKIMMTMPVAISRPKGSRARLAARRPRNSRKANSANSSSAPSRPSSSQHQDVVAGGRLKVVELVSDAFG
jgi:hypothetical protein